LCSSGISACALLSKAEIVEPRYFSPERTNVSSSRASSPETTRLELRVGRVLAGPNLRERIAYQDAQFERGYYEEFRWAERPEVYVRRALGRALFEEHGFVRVLGGAAPTLDVEVIAFDELRSTRGQAVRVQLKIMLSQDNVVVLEETLTEERTVAHDTHQTIPSGKRSIEPVVAALAVGLDVAVTNAAVNIERALRARLTTAREGGAHPP
jgi:cholesterol transport system auxiliary component